MNILNIIPLHILERFTERAKGALEECERAAKLYSPENTHEVYIDVVHLFYALSKQKGTMAHNIISSHHIEEQDVVRAIKDANDSLRLRPETGGRSYKTLSSDPPKVLISDSFTRCLKKAATLASSEHHVLLGTEHLLWGVLNETGIPLIEEEKLREMKRHLRNLLKNSNGLPNLSLFPRSSGFGRTVPHSLHQTSSPHHLFPQTPEHQIPPEHQNKHRATSQKSPMSPKKTSSPIEYFCRDLTLDAEKGLLSPCVGREQEIKRVVRILSRKTKNNPLLLGEPGVGKTAIVEGLAQHIVRGDVPENLLRKKIYSLDLGLLIAGTVFRGEFEARIKDLLEELGETSDILFIDEFHNVVGTGSVQGTLDAANILKPVLSEGLVQCIGATTHDEFTKYIERDPALERRLQPVYVPEPTQKETLRILAGLKRYYERHYQIRIPAKTIATVVELASRYIPDRFLPDKAIDLLDEAASDLVSSSRASKETREIKKIEQEYRGILERKEEAIRDEQYENALTLKHQEEELKGRLDAALSFATKTRPSPAAHELTPEHVTKMVAELTGIPLRTISNSHTTQLFTRIERHLEQRIVGQKDIVKKVGTVLRRAHAGLNDPKRPLGSFLFLGPTGVGKTEFAKTLAKIFSQGKNDSHALVKLDMAEFAEAHTISKIIGAPPGYVGYEEGSRILERIRRNPFSVVLLDEIEKAHPNVYNILLEILEDGELTSADAKKVSFKNAVIIMTSNIGTEEFTNEAALGFRGSRGDMSDTEAKYKEIEAHTKAELKKIMRPELLSRIDSILVFRPLTRAAIERIVALELKDLQKRIKDYKMHFSPELVAHLAEKAFNPEEGARLIRRVIEEHIESPLADSLLRGEVKGKRINLGIKNGKITFNE